MHGIPVCVHPGCLAVWQGTQPIGYVPYATAQGPTRFMTGAANSTPLSRTQSKNGQLDQLPKFQSLGAVAQQAHPSHEHYLPLLVAAGAVRQDEMPRFFNTGFQSASISMRSVLWG